MSLSAVVTRVTNSNCDSNNNSGDQPIQMLCKRKLDQPHFRSNQTIHLKPARQKSMAQGQAVANCIWAPKFKSVTN